MRGPNGTRVLGPVFFLHPGGTEPRRAVRWEICLLLQLSKEKPGEVVRGRGDPQDALSQTYKVEMGAVGPLVLEGDFKLIQESVLDTSDKSKKQRKPKTKKVLEVIKHDFAPVDPWSGGSGQDGGRDGCLIRRLRLGPT
ncbi:hypothetical protein NDU88_000184 [Pleurodeles waltl]|uniref:Uncharacterized protein n=1 Tax=Pleurodeles waltl TaxID=8319 RepID=A0AAV7VWN1_PLEWA|nr:hypothetical protein NDU88_000184 [Pleurodeles waltl]